MFTRFGRMVKRRLFGVTQDAPAPPETRHVWSIGIYSGANCLEFAPPDTLVNPVLTDASVSNIRTNTVADPFMLRVDGCWYMFFEVMNERTGKGVIGLATSEDGAAWAYQGIVLREPFHLSYPYVFEHQGEFYMIPECYESHAVRLYRATKFPRRWSMVGTLLTGPVLLDPSIVRFGDRWWLFVETNPELKWDTLRLYGAGDLMGPWSEHPASPIVQGDPHTARPAGRVVVTGDTLIRYAQNCAPQYGTDVRAFEVTELTDRSYHERPASAQPILGPSGIGWNRSGMHHIDPHRVDGGKWIACVDGWFAASGAGVRGHHA